MISFKCKNCGGEATISASGDLYCPYCGSKANFSDADIRGYKIFRKRMLEYLAAISDNHEKAEDAEWLWENADEKVFKAADGSDITVRYIYESSEDGIEMYAAKNAVLYRFPASKLGVLDAVIQNVSKVTFPQADMKNLKKCVPDYNGKYELEDGAVLLTYTRPDGFYPLPLFGNLPYEHVAWIVSRLENIACLLAYNGMTHGGITPEAVFINPKTHEAALLGNWGKMRAGESTKDLQDLRDTARKLLGCSFDGAPKMFKEFLQGKPKKNAFEDFGYWDEVIEKGLGGRHFHVLSTDDIKL